MAEDVVLGPAGEVEPRARRQEVEAGLGQVGAVLARMPVFNSIYHSVKHVSHTVFSPTGQAFRKALLVQWPSEGMWTIAFLTGSAGGDVANHLRDDYLSVYVPTTPNPTGGYFVLVARKDLIELDMSVDQALKYIISMGVVAPVPNGRPWN